MIIYVDNKCGNNYMWQQIQVDHNSSEISASVIKFVIT